MPTYRSITLTLISQFDVLTLPEFAPPTRSTDPFSPTPTLINTDRSLVSVYIPTYPNSQFWLAYSVAAPHPPNAIFYFKLFVNGTAVLSWGCGEDDGFKGKTMFGIFETELPDGSEALEKRLLGFGPDDPKAAKMHKGSLSDVMEIRVFRSRGRTRINPLVSTFHDTPFGKETISKAKSKDGGINLPRAGLLAPRHPTRYYRYHLLDPLDKPFATFRYYHRSWDELERLDVISPSSSCNGSSSSVDLAPEGNDNNSSESSVLHHNGSKAKTTTTRPHPSPSPTPAQNQPSPSPLHLPLLNTYSLPLPPSSILPPDHPSLLPRSSPTKNPNSTPLLVPRVVTPVPNPHTEQVNEPGRTRAAFASQITGLVRRRTPSPEKEMGKVRGSLDDGVDGNGGGALGAKEKGSSLAMLRAVLDSAVRRKGKGRGGG